MKMLSCIFVLGIFLFTTSTAQTTGTVRLYRNGVPDTSQSWSSGIVQIYYSGSWGNICDDSSFAIDEADVICHQLGYSGASSYSNTGTTTTWGTDFSSTKLDDVSCTFFTYFTITQCSFSTFISSSCTNSDDVTVSCYSTRIWSSPITGDIRLTGGTYSNQGLLEVYCNGEWGTVCDNQFGSTEASVACNQLGYNDYSTYDTLSITGDSSQEIFLRILAGCASSDDCLTECGGCPSNGVGTRSCSHSEDITLTCSYSSTDSKIGSTTANNCVNYDYSSTSVNTGSLVGAVIGGVIALIVCLVFSIGVPICICVCLGVGVGAAARGSTRTRVVTQPAATTTAAVVTTQQNTSYPSTTSAAYPAQQPAPQQYNEAEKQQGGGYPTQPAPYPTQPAAYPPQQQGYPPQQQGYPPQQQGYPPQQQGYPPQQAPPGYYDGAQQPPAAYPPQ